MPFPADQRALLACPLELHEALASALGNPVQDHAAQGLSPAHLGNQAWRDLSVVYRYASRVLCLSKGEVCMGPPKEIMTPEMLEQLYGAPPKYYRHIQEH